MWKIYNKAKENTSPEILLYDTIAGFNDNDFGYVSGKKLINEIKALANEKEIVLRINSNGGDIFQAFAIYNTLKESKASITVKVDGIAASAASLTLKSSAITRSSLWPTPTWTAPISGRSFSPSSSAICGRSSTMAMSIPPCRPSTS